MRIALAFVTALSIVTPSFAPTIADLGTAVSARHQTILAEANLPSPGSHDTALAENESNGPTRFGHDTAQVAEANLPSPGNHDTAV